jgi:hypothetical protein
MRWIGQLATAVNRTSDTQQRRRVGPTPGTSSPGARRKYQLNRRGR